MKRLSSSQTFLIKKVFPKVFYGFLGVLVLSALAGFLKSGDKVLLVFIPLAFFLALLIPFFMKKDMEGIVDQIWDDGSHLLIIDDGREDCVALSNIREVLYVFGRIPRVTLLMHKPCLLGESVSFLPTVSSLVSREKVALELRQRIQAQ